MKTLYRIVALMIVAGLQTGTCPTSASESLVWRWSNPRGHGNNIVAMAHRDGWIVQVAERGQIYVSRDLESWVPRHSGTTHALRSVTFFGEKIVITGERGLVLVAPSIQPNHQFQRIDLQTSDWLEGITAAPDLLIAVGDNGAVYSSRDAIAWQKHPQPFNTWLRGVAYAAGMFVAVGEHGFIATSTDGTAWQRRNTSATEHLNRVTWANGRFVVTGESGRLLTSADAVSWESVPTGSTHHLNTAAASPDAWLVAGNNELRLQENAVWTDQIRSTNSFPAPNWTYLSSVWDGTLFLVGGRSGRIVEGFKTNANSSTIWVERRNSVRSWLWDTFRASDFYIAVGDRGTVMTSDDGIRWELELVPGSLANAVFLGIGGTTNRYIAVGSKGSMITSSNGVLWDAVQLPTDNDLQGVAARNGLFVVTGGNGTILTSTDTVQWQVESSGTTAFLSSATAFPGGFIVTGSSGTILKSPDGRTWSRLNSGTTNWIYRVRYLEGQLIAVGQNGTVLTSTDAVHWSPRSSGTTRWLNDIAKVNGSFFIAGTQGTLLQSRNAIDWNATGTITEKSLFSLTSDGVQLIAAGVEGVILRSRVVPDLTPVRIESYSHSHGQNLFLFSGNPDQRFTLDRTLNLSRWAGGAQLEFTDGATTLLHLEQSPQLPHEFFRARLRN